MFLFFCSRDMKKSLPLFLFNKSLPPARPSQLFNKYWLHFLMQTHSFVVWARCTKYYNYTTWQSNRKLFYVGAVIKINVLIFHLHKIISRKTLRKTYIHSFWLHGAHVHCPCMFIPVCPVRPGGHTQG